MIYRIRSILAHPYQMSRKFPVTKDTKRDAKTNQIQNNQAEIKKHTVGSLEFVSCFLVLGAQRRGWILPGAPFCASVNNEFLKDFFITIEASAAEGHLPAALIAQSGI